MTDSDLSTSQDISSIGSHSQSLYQSLENDIGKLTELNTKLDREVQYCILTREPNPDQRAYPRKRLHEGKAKRQFQPSWAKLYPWLHYSEHVDGAFCCACAFFAPSKVGGQLPGSFVTKPDHINRADSEHFNQGNFIELIRFRAEHDEIQAQHLTNSPHNARYTSNQLIEVVGNSIQNGILEEIKKGKFYSIIADEVADVYNWEQLVGDGGAKRRRRWGR